VPNVSGVDSSFCKPTPVLAAHARAAGYSLWSGYIATGGGVRLAAPWSQQEFDYARLVGGTPIAYCSGWDDPVALRILAGMWHVRLCLDVEDGIRGDGPWVQPFLDSSGAGLYGNAGVFPGRRAAFYVEAEYPLSGDPFGDSWPPRLARPPGPCAWQWAGTHSEFGCDVDSMWADPWFAGGSTPFWLTYQRRIRPMLVTLAPEQASPTQPFVIPSPIAASGRHTFYNLASHLGCDCQLFAWDLAGRVLGATARFTVQGNAPGQHGPVPVSGGQDTFRDGGGNPLGDVGPYTLGVINFGPGDVTLVLHDE
jgi:hypothetical protein